MSLKSTLKDMGVKLQDVAKEIGLTYDQLYSTLESESGGNVTRQVTKDRVELVNQWITSHKEMVTRVEKASEGKDDFTAQLLSREMKSWDLAIKNNRMPNITRVFEFEGFSCGQMVSVETRDGDKVRVRILSMDTHTDGRQWVNAFGGKKGEEQYITLDPVSLGI